MFKESLRKSKELLKGKRLTLWGVIILFFSAILGVSMSKDAVIINVASFLIGLPASFGLMRYLINIYHKKEKLEDLIYYFENYSKNWKLILATLWYTLIVSIGLCLLIVPGIIWAYRYVLVFYILITDERVSIKKAFEMSKEKMHGHKFKYFAACIVLAIAPLLIITIGAACVGFGSYKLAVENPDALERFESNFETLLASVSEDEELNVEFNFNEEEDEETPEIIEEEVDAEVLEVNHKTPWGFTGVLAVGIVLLCAGWLWLFLLYPRLLMVETTYGMELLSKDKKEE